MGTATFALGVLTAIVLVPPTPVSAIEKNSASAILRELKQKSRDRVLYYLYNTPIMQEEPYFEVSVQLGDTIIVGEYTPRYAGEPLPAAWAVGDTVQVRLEKHYLYLQRPKGGELKFVISDRYTRKAVSKH